MTPVGISIRPAADADIPAMRNLEVDAGRRFDGVGLKTIADDDPPSPDVLAAHVAAGTAWMAVDQADGGAVGYAVASVVDGEGHLDQVSVSTTAAGRRIGAALVETVCRWADGQDLEAVTLTTFRDVPWNGPLYRRLGFEVVPETALGPQLRAIRTEEGRRGIDVVPRVAMRRTLR